jgi:hypothetical protein
MQRLIIFLLLAMTSMPTFAASQWYGVANREEYRVDGAPYYYSCHVIGNEDCMSGCIPIYSWYVEDSTGRHYPIPFLRDPCSGGVLQFIYYLSQDLNLPYNYINALDNDSYHFAPIAMVKYQGRFGWQATFDKDTVYYYYYSYDSHNNAVPVWDTMVLSGTVIKYATGSLFTTCDSCTALDGFYTDSTSMCASQWRFIDFYVNGKKVIYNPAAAAVRHVAPSPANAARSAAVTSASSLIAYDIRGKMLQPQSRATGVYIIRLHNGRSIKAIGRLSGSGKYWDATVR